MKGSQQWPSYVGQCKSPNELNSKEHNFLFEHMIAWPMAPSANEKDSTGDYYGTSFKLKDYNGRVSIGI